MNAKFYYLKVPRHGQ